MGGYLDHQRDAGPEETIGNRRGFVDKASETLFTMMAISVVGAISSRVVRDVPLRYRHLLRRGCSYTVTEDFGLARKRMEKEGYDKKRSNHSVC